MKAIDTVCQACGATKQPMIVWGKWRLGCVPCRSAKAEAKAQAKTEANNRRLEPRCPGAFQIAFRSRLDGSVATFTHRPKRKP